MTLVRSQLRALADPVISLERRC